MFNNLSDLYQELIIDHNSQPRNFGVINDASHKAHGVNPICGDDVYVFLEIRYNSIKNISFTGNSCAICKASASIMTDKVKGKKIKDVEFIIQLFHALIVQKDITALKVDSLGKLLAFSGIRNFPMRVKCATLAWHTLCSAMKGINFIKLK